MAKVKLALQNLTALQLLELADTILTRMTGNASFPTPNPTLAALQGLRDTVQSRNTTAEEARSISEQRTKELNTAARALDGGLTSLGSYVENASGGDETKIRSSGMDVRDPASPIGELPQVQNLTLTTGDQDGELDAAWDRVKGSRIFEVQTSVDPFTPASWTPRTSVTASKVTLSGLPGGTRVWVRVRAMGTAGPGPWSDPAVRTAP